MKTRWYRVTAAVALGLALTGPARAGTTYYVSPDGSHTAPFTTWATAATNIQDAVSQMTSWQTDVCLVTNGHYVLTNTITFAAAGVELRSVNGPAVTIIDGNDAVRCVNVGTYCTVRGFTITRGRHASVAGGAYLGGNSWIDGCILVSNSAPYGAAAYLLDQTAIRNSILMANSNGAVYCHWGGEVDNCLVLSNATTVSSGGAVHLNEGGYVRNTISYYNHGTAPLPNWKFVGLATAARFQFCNTTPDIGSATCFTDVPDFRDAANGNYRFYPGSLWVNSGTNLAWMTAAAKDLDGNPRTNGVCDIGPYELTPGALLCSFSASPRSGGEPLAVTLTAAVSGTNQTSLYYRWDLDNNGSIDAEGVGLSTLATNYLGGAWSVSLSVSNAAGEVSARTRANYISVSPGTLYVVASGGTPTPPYGSWGTAATNIQDALDAAADGVLILVSNGAFGVASPVSVTKAVTVRGMGADVTVIDGGGVSRCVTIANSAARLERLQLRNGYAAHGAGAYLDLGGTLVDCTIAGNTALTNGAGIYLSNGGLVSGCTIVSNTAGASGNGGGVYSSGTGGTVSNSFLGWNKAGNGGGYCGAAASRIVFSTVVSNRTTVLGGAGGWAGGIYCTGGGAHVIANCTIAGNQSGQVGGGVVCYSGLASSVIRNCLLRGNQSDGTGGALYTHTANLDMDNCTVVDNTAVNAGGIALSWDAHSVRNCIIYGNAGTPNTNWYTTAQASQDISFTCTMPLPTYGTDDITVDPLFRNPAAGDYTLQDGSPCVNAGSDEGWMNTSVDLAGNARILQDRVDMGAFELPPPRGSVITLR